MAKRPYLKVRRHTVTIDLPKREAEHLAVLLGASYGSKLENLFDALWESMEDPSGYFGFEADTYYQHDYPRGWTDKEVPPISWKDGKEEW